MQLIVGLGNPGAQYAGNRHNIGWMAVDRIAADHGFSPWRARFQGLAAEGRLGGEKVVALKPQTFMNTSGQSVGEAMRYLKLDPADVVVLHDELDLAPGKVRVKTGGVTRAITGCGRSTSTWARGIAACGWGSVIRGTRTGCRATCCRTSPRPTRTGWTT